MSKRAPSAPNSMEWRRSELLADVHDHIRRALESRGIQRSVAQAASVVVVEMVSRHWAGQQINFPSRYGVNRPARDAAILAALATHSIADLASEYGISERAIRKARQRALLRQNGGLQ